LSCSGMGFCTLSCMC